MVVLRGIEPSAQLLPGGQRKRALTLSEAFPITGAPCPGSKILNSSSEIFLTESIACAISRDNIFEGSNGLPFASLLRASPAKKTSPGR
jgi:hypothetical protein